jgi:hypothetical protein
MMRLGLAVLLMLPMQPVISADNYVLLHKAEEGSWEFDTASIVTVSEGLRQSKTRLNLAHPLRDAATGVVYDKILFLYEHDCALNRIRVLDNIAYLGGSPAAISHVSSEWQAAADSAAHKYACGLVEEAADTHADH